MDEQNEKICIELLNRSTQVCTIFGASLWDTPFFGSRRISKVRPWKADATSSDPAQ